MNFYFVLGVDRHASIDEVRRAYRRLARKYHPNINPGDPDATERYRLITEAYETLADPERRRRYDSLGEEPPAVESRFEFAGFDFSVRAEGPRAYTFGELFADALQPGTGVGPEQGADLHVGLTLTLEEVAKGARRTVTVTRLEACGPCGGRGYVVGPSARCLLCEGSGQLRGVRRHMVFARVCPSCAGSGETRHRRCGACGGEGVGARTDAVEVDVPAGIPDGTEFSVAGHGHVGRRGGQPGDLRVTVTVAPHPYFKRSGRDLLLEVPIGVHEAALGARIEVPMLDGTASLKVPPSTRSGQTFRLRERGITGRDGRPGDLLVTVRVMLPELLDERSKELLREFGERNPFGTRVPLGA